MVGFLISRNLIPNTNQKNAQILRDKSIIFRLTKFIFAVLVFKPTAVHGAEYFFTIILFLLFPGFWPIYIKRQSNRFPDR